MEVEDAMRLLCVSLVLTIALAGCGRNEQSEQRAQTMDVRESPPVMSYAPPPEAVPEPPPSAPPPTASARARPDEPTRAPEIAPTAAPGVAFTYNYAFRLAAERIAQVQERHARACEGLGPNRCRITGMEFRNAETVEASLSLALEPGIARAFGREGLAAVEQAEGSLVESAISGTDAASGIRRSGQDLAQLRADLRRIEQDLARRAAGDSERQTLQFNADQLRRQIGAAEDSRTDQQESLATTPMTFHYASAAVAGGNERPEFGPAAARAWDGFLWGLYTLFVVLARLLPWLAMLGVGFVLVRWFWRWLEAVAHRRDATADALT
jgi:hypothetical protein